MRILILGGNGMLGHKLFQTLEAQHEVHATFRGRITRDALSPIYREVESARLHWEVDATALDTVTAVVASVRPDVVLNCIGIIKQLPSANDAMASITVNALFPHQLAERCTAVGARLVLFSTDCVFSGRKGYYSEADASDVDNLYGRTKFLGEIDRPGVLTIRTSFIGRDFYKDVGLLEWFLGHRHGRVRGYRNFIYSGLTTLAMARIVADLLRDFPGLSGLYHVAGAPISKYDLLARCATAMKLEISVDAYDDPPCNRSLDPARFLAATGYRIPEWNEMLGDLAADPTPYDSWKRQHGSGIA